jgi:hypothetical protein
MKCNSCGSQKALYISNDTIGKDEQEKHIAELHDEVDMLLGTSDTKIINTRGIDYFVCSCGNYTSVREIKESLMSRGDLHKVVL